ncbi:hypothetical protein B0A49_06127 [Cryomyces minteri]|uniref:Protein root UVB sensitive/RUS domain-containing protein n=1 Tax=Cryomyces minteri TaxID=331657 RepID=A0A4V5NFJ1_9PEZI|nr:hypothetical protein B0A49_06127 [Cryomyces minteri]
MGRIATILFAHKLGTSLEPEAKMYRLAADVFNDTAMILDCLSPAFPKLARVLILSSSSVLRALCGVAAGSSKASLSAHFAKWGNLGELNAKDSSQETVVSLMGMLAGSLVVSWVSSPLATWSTLLLLLSIHLATNHAAVRAVSMRTLNRQRANLVFSHLIEDDEVLTPEEVSKKERIFDWDGVVRWKGGQVIGHVKIGLKAWACAIGMLHDASSLTVDHEKTLGQVLQQTLDEDRPAAIVQLLAFLEITGQKFDGWVPRLKQAGWNLDVAALETHSGSRLARDEMSA